MAIDNNMSQSSFLCSNHTEPATSFCLCSPNPLFLCIECHEKHANHDIYPQSLYQCYCGPLGKNSADLRRRTDISKRCYSFLEKLSDRERAIHSQAKELMKAVTAHYDQLLEESHNGFVNLHSTLERETKDLLAKSDPRMSPITQALHDRLSSLTPEIEHRLVHIPEEETLTNFAKRCNSACSRTFEVWQTDYKMEALNALTGRPGAQQEAEPTAVTQLREAQERCETLSREKEVLQQQFESQATQWKAKTDTLKSDNDVLQQELDSQATQWKAKTEALTQQKDSEVANRVAIQAKLEKTHLFEKLGLFLMVCLVAWVVLLTRGALTGEPEFSRVIGLAENNYDERGLSQTLQQNEGPVHPNIRNLDNLCQVQYYKLGPYSGQEKEMALVWRHELLAEGEYIGQFNNHHQKHGYGINVYSDGYLYEGYWQNGTKSGNGRFIDSYGEVYTGEFVKNKREGLGTKHYADDSVYTGMWANNEKQGTGSMKSGNKTIWAGDQVFGEWFLNELHGRGAYFYGNGTIYAGTFQHYKLHGKGMIWYPDERVCVGNWERGQLSGMGTCLYPNGNVYTGKWVNGVKYGQGTLTHPGIVDRKVWTNDY